MGLARVAVMHGAAVDVLVPEQTAQLIDAVIAHCRQSRVAVARGALR